VDTPATLTTALNPSELSARGTAIQASLIVEFKNEDIEQSTHKEVTAALTSRNPIGVVSGADSGFQTILETQTATPAQRMGRSIPRSILR